MGGGKMTEHGARDRRWSSRCDTQPGSFPSVDFSEPIIKQGSCHCPVHSLSEGTTPIKTAPQGLVMPWEATNVTFSSKTLHFLAQYNKEAGSWNIS